ncbi:MAG: hypothetical protein A2X93_01365 [Deltaproteobacteria bacterium GWC2_56_8]|nr:MAG: hypothetical protein A2X99_06575 [Deltaproteobacteria bacterium GWB2_55_19]OGP32971.1 MAG: hypothetical protein A2X93_01365 [Deltaproteobacteria bacterium GWC2_56_8]HAO93648.1 hypothetical protein [Deltaproteobacteria bacterium]
MELWVIVLSAVDLALMGGILYIMASKKILRRPGPDPAPSIDHIKALESEISGIRRLSAELERKKAMFERHEDTMGERTRRLDAAVKQAEDSAKKLEARYLSEKNEDMYGRAVKMLKAGTPADEVVRNLGLLSGEVDLMSSLNNYR